MPRSRSPGPGSARPASSPEPTYRKPPLPGWDEIAAYYRLMGPHMLPFLAGRPLNLYRCTAGRCFFQRNRRHPATAEDFGPPIRHAPLLQKNGRTEDYLFVEDDAGILACVGARAVEFHAWGSRLGDVERPDRLAIDLDPGEGATFDLVREAAFQVRRSLAAIGLKSWPLLSGGKGVHVVVPIRPERPWGEVRAFAHAFCSALAEAAPDRFTVALPKAERHGRIFLDYLRNQRTATAIMPWSLRARPGAPVAAPVAWKALETVEGADLYRIGDAAALSKRAARMRSWGAADQQLPAL